MPGRVPQDASIRMVSVSPSDRGTQFFTSAMLLLLLTERLGVQRRPPPSQLLQSILLPLLPK